MATVVTGAGGFVGRELVRQLLAAGHSVTATDSAAHAIPAGARVVAGDLGDAAVRAEALEGCTALVHLATVPGGAAEADPTLSRRINLDASYDLMCEAAALHPGLRVVFASSIAVFGEAWPARVDDRTPTSPKLVYGGHKAMIEQAVALFSNRGAIDGVSLRLPGVLARPRAPSGMKSAFLSELFHALRAGEAFTCPVSAEGTIWAQSVRCAVRNLAYALTVDAGVLPRTRALTLPALRVSVGDLVGEVARQCRASPSLVTYVPDPALEAGFAAQPPLSTPAADRAGFAHDGSLAALVENALVTLDSG